METSIKSSRRNRPRRKKKQKEIKILKEKSKYPSRHLAISKRVFGEAKCKKVHMRDQYLGSVIQDLCEGHMSFNKRHRKNLSQNKHWEKNLCEQTIDLCDVDSQNSSVLLVSSLELKQRNDVVDISNELPDQSEIIDLTETMTSPNGCPNTKISLEPTVIDISEDNSDDQNSNLPINSKPENDEIFVIGTFNKNSDLSEEHGAPSIIPLSNRWNNFSNLITCSEKLKRKYLMKRSVLDKIDNKNKSHSRKGLWRPKETSRVGGNIYVHSPQTLPSSGLRPIIIDGSNVAFVHSNCNFSCKRLEICINYFKEKGHKVTAFVPQYRINSNRSDNPQLLRRLERQGDVVLTPSKKVDGRNIVPYDDRFIVQTAVLKGGIIVTRDNYNDLLKENPAWAETIKYRTLAFTWVDDVLMFPKDPLGEYGPSLEEFLRFH